MHPGCGLLWSKALAESHSPAGQQAEGERTLEAGEDTAGRPGEQGKASALASGSEGREDPSPAKLGRTRTEWHRSLPLKLGGEGPYLQGT